MRHPLLLIAVVLGLAAVACGGSPNATSAPATQSTGPTVQLVDFALQPAALSEPSGTTISVVNAGKAPHNLSIRGAGGKVVARTANLQPGERTTLKLALAPGSYVDFCSEPGHESLGMRGTLTIV